MSLLDDILSILRGNRGRISLFCGAGISVASGLPTASALLECILSSLGIDPIDINSLKSQDGNWRMPFEAFMEAFIEHDQNTTLFDIFLLGAPNQNHFLIKNLALKGCIDEICTTNFDLMIERIFESAPSLPLTVVLEGSSQSTSARDDQALYLVKLHGTAANHASIRSTIQSIAFGPGFNARAKLIERVRASESEVLWVWGYSCSDILDITPAITSLRRKDKTVVLLQHDPTITDLATAVVAPLSDSASDNPFHGYMGYTLRVNADVLVKELLDGDSYSFGGAVDAGQWRALIDKWINSLGYSHVKYSILCHLFYNLAEYSLALKYNTMAIQSNDGKDERGRGAALSNRGMILHLLGRSDEALVAFREALTVFDLIEYPFGVVTSYNNIGYVCGYLGRFKEAYDHLEFGFCYLASHTFKETRLCEGYLHKSHGELSVLEGKFAAAEQSYNRALSVFKEGYIAEESEVVMLKGNLYRLTGRPDDGDEIIRQAISLASKVGYAQVALEGARLLERG